MMVCETDLPYINHSRSLIPKDNGFRINKCLREEKDFFIQLNVI